MHRSPASGPEAAVEEIEPGDADSKRINERNDLFGDRRPEWYLTGGA
jgi:hypothetical protein